MDSSSLQVGKMVQSHYMISSTEMKKMSTMMEVSLLSPSPSPIAYSSLQPLQKCGFINIEPWAQTHAWTTTTVNSIEIINLETLAIANEITTDDMEQKVNYIIGT